MQCWKETADNEPYCQQAERKIGEFRLRCPAVENDYFFDAGLPGLDNVHALQLWSAEKGIDLRRLPHAALGADFRRRIEGRAAGGAILDCGRLGLDARRCAGRGDRRLPHAALRADFRRQIKGCAAGDAVLDRAALRWDVGVDSRRVFYRILLC